MNTQWILDAMRDYRLDHAFSHGHVHEFEDARPEVEALIGRPMDDAQWNEFVRKFQSGMQFPSEILRTDTHTSREPPPPYIAAEADLFREAIVRLGTLTLDELRAFLREGRSLVPSPTPTPGDTP